MAKIKQIKLERFSDRRQIQAGSGKLVTTQIAEPPPRDSDSGGLEWGLRP